MIRIACLLLAVSLAVPFSSSRISAQSADAAAAAITAETGPVWTPEIIDDTLDNGLRILFTRVNDIPLAEISVLVDAGMMREPADMPSLAYVVNQMLLRGSADRSRDMAERRLDQLGSVVLPYVHYDYAQVYARTLTKNFRSTLEILADAVLRPTFPEDQLLAFQREASTTLVPFGQSAGERTSIAALRALCGPDAAVSHPLIPAESEVTTLTSDDLRRFHESWYQPSATTVVVTGNLDYGFLRTLLLEAFGRWRPAEQAASLALPETEPDRDNRARIIDDTSTAKGLAYYRMGTLAPPRADPDAPALLVLHHILAEADTSRLREALWGKNVISPTFTSSLVFSRSCSYLMISGSAPPAQAERILGILADVMTALSEQSVTAWELQRAKKALLAESPLMFASNRNLQKLLKEAVVYGLTVEESLRLPALIERVTAEDVQRMAQRILRQGNFQLTVLGDASVLSGQLERAGRDVRVIRIEE